MVLKALSYTIKLSKHVKSCVWICRVHPGVHGEVAGTVTEGEGNDFNYFYGKGLSFPGMGHLGCAACRW